jgi:hypothetical protein
MDPKMGTANNSKISCIKGLSGLDNPLPAAYHIKELSEHTSFVVHQTLSPFFSNGMRNRQIHKLPPLPIKT